MRPLFSCMIALSLLAGACRSPASNLPGGDLAAYGDAFDTFARRFSSAYEDLALPATNLSFVANLKQLGTTEDLEMQRAVFSDLTDRLQHFDPDNLDVCRRIDLSVMQVTSRFGLRRAKLALRFVAMDSDVSSAERLTDVALGSDWYRYFLDRWNDTELDPEAMFAFGERQLARSVARYDRLQWQLGFAGDDAGLALHLASPAGHVVDDGATIELLKATQRRVFAQLGDLFPDTYGVGPARIAKSDRGAGFAVPGYYIADEQTFYYTALDDDGFEVRQADWLYLHEGTPGHHFFSAASRTAKRCDSPLAEFFFAAYVEGWAAYTESLGKALGLYATPEAELAAVEWDMVRSVRVALDIAINLYGWSDKKALAYWHANVRGQHDIAMREIDRIKRWPGQVVTYKYGADVFQRAKEATTTGTNPPWTVKQFHDTAITYGAMPLETFEGLLEELLRFANSSEYETD